MGCSVHRAGSPAQTRQGSLVANVAGKQCPELLPPKAGIRVDPERAYD